MNSRKCSFWIYLKPVDQKPDSQSTFLKPYCQGREDGWGLMIMCPNSTLAMRLCSDCRIFSWRSWLNPQPNFRQSPPFPEPGRATNLVRWLFVGVLLMRTTAPSAMDGRWMENEVHQTLSFTISDGIAIPVPAPGICFSFRKLFGNWHSHLDWRA
jgi:hypothetical protein